MGKVLTFDRGARRDIQRVVNHIELDRLMNVGVGRMRDDLDKGVVARVIESLPGPDFATKHVSRHPWFVAAHSRLGVGVAPWDQVMGSLISENATEFRVRKLDRRDEQGQWWERN